MNTKNAKPDFFKPEYGLENAGLKTSKTVYWNYSTPALYEEAIKRQEGNVVYGGPLCVSTGKHTGRSPNDRFFVKTADVEGKLWFSKGNVGIEPKYWDILFAKAQKYVHRAQTRRTQKLRAGIYFVVLAQIESRSGHRWYQLRNRHLD